MPKSGSEMGKEIHGSKGTEGGQESTGTSLHPSSVADLSRALTAAHANGERVRAADLRAMNRILRHTPEDMTVTVETGITLAGLQRELAGANQWIPIDPPDPDHLTIRELLAEDWSGPRRFGFGTIREHLIGIQAVLADGRNIRSGGQVVKNVAGFDLCRLFVGDRGTLGVVVEATFRLRPVQETEAFLSCKARTLSDLSGLIQRILESELTPTVLDLDGGFRSVTSPTAEFRLILGIAGTREEVEWQVQQARSMGIQDETGLDHELDFWMDDSALPVRHWSVLPSRLVESLEELRPDRFIARAGNGVVYGRGGGEPAPSVIPMRLMQQVKQTFDPRGVFPPTPF